MEITNNEPTNTNTASTPLKTCCTMLELLKTAPKPIPLYNCSNNLRWMYDLKLFSDNFTVIGGDSSGGKTSIACQIALDLLQHNPNLHLLLYSLDDGLNFILPKLIKQLLNDSAVSNDLLELSAVDYVSIYNYIQCLDAEVQNRIHIHTDLTFIADKNDPSKNDDNIGLNLKELKNLGHDVIVVIDYVQIIEVVNRDKEYRHALNDICKYLKSLQQVAECYMIVLSQLGYEGNLRESSEIKNIADVILQQSNEFENSIKRGSDYSSKQDKSDNPNSDIFKTVVAKCKHGSRGQTYFSRINSNFIYSEFTTNKDKLYTKNTGKERGQSKGHSSKSAHEYYNDDYNKKLAETKRKGIEEYLK